MGSPNLRSRHSAAAGAALLIRPISGTGSLWLIYKAAAGKTTNLILDVPGYFE